MKTIGLCMIVKNESKVILRSLESVRPIVDYVLIEDTGSADGTQTIIREWLGRVGLSGEVYDEPWQDFAHNRSQALARLREQKDMDYALILDADDVMVFQDGFDAAAFKKNLSQDIYDVELRNGPVRYRRAQICSNRREFGYRGVLHEFLQGPPGPISRGTTTGFYISSTREGARSQDPAKYRKDAALLEKALQTEQDPFLRSRYTFYLARSYQDAGKKEQALEAFLKRAALGCWTEEIFISLYSAGHLQQALGRPVEEVIATFLRASDAAPGRAEALHAASRLCREKNKFAEGFEYARRGLAVPLPAGGLFVVSWIYEYGLLDEFAVNAYWTERYQDCLEACQRLLREGKMPPHMHDRVKRNADFAAEKIRLQCSNSKERPAPIIENVQSCCIIDKVVNEDGKFIICSVPADRNLPSWTVVAAHISGYRHSAALQELVEAVFYGLKQLDLQVFLADGHGEISKNTIIIGGHLLSPEQCAKVPDGAVIYNSERAGSHWFNDNYITLLRRTVVWDYSADNTQWLRERLRRPVLYVPLGYVPQFTRIRSRMPSDEDIDILFYGSSNSRRNHVFDEIRSRGLVFHNAFGVYGAARDALIERAKVVLNIHIDVPGAFEILRIGYLLSNKKAVITEVNHGETIDSDLEGAFVTAPYESIASKAADLVANPLARTAIATVGYRKFTCRSQAAILRDALGERIGLGP